MKSHATPKSESTRTTSLNPDEQLKAAQARVVKLVAALVAIGEEDPAAAGLQEALSKARLQAQVRPVQDRITHTEAFLSRSKKKLETLNAEASRIQEELAQVSTRIREGERRLEALKAEATAQPSPFTMQPDPQEEIRLLASTDRPDGKTRFDGGWNPGGFAEETQDVCHIFCRFSAIHECPTTGHSRGR